MLGYVFYPPRPDGPPNFAVGELVVVHGLAAHAHLNGLDARVVREVDSDGRLGVLPDGAAAPVSVRLRNLRAVCWMERVPDVLIEALMLNLLPVLGVVALSACNRRLRQLRPSLDDKFARLNRHGLVRYLEIAGHAAQDGAEFSAVEAPATACAHRLARKKFAHTEESATLARSAVISLLACLRIAPQPMWQTALATPAIEVFRHLSALFDPSFELERDDQGPSHDAVLHIVNEMMKAASADLPSSASTADASTPVDPALKNLLSAGCLYYTALAGLSCHRDVAVRVVLYTPRSARPQDMEIAAAKLRHPVRRPSDLGPLCDMCNPQKMEVQEMIARATDAIKQVHAAMIAFPQDANIQAYGCFFYCHMAAHNPSGGATNVVFGGSIFTNWRQGWRGQRDGLTSVTVEGLDDIEVGNVIVDSMDNHPGDARVQHGGLQALLELYGTHHCQDEYLPSIVLSMRSHPDDGAVTRYGKALLKRIDWAGQLSWFPNEVLAECEFEDEDELSEWIEASIAEA